MMRAMNINIRADENDIEKATKVKKAGAVTTDTTKRAALGDLKNRGPIRAAGGKDAAQKDIIKEKKTQNALRMVKARVDSQLKKPATQAPSSIATENKVVAKAAVVPERKVLTRSNSLRTSNTAATAVPRLCKATSVSSNKPKIVTAKVTENKLQHVKYITKGKPAAQAQIDEKKQEGAKAAAAAPGPLRREDSNISRKSLIKLKAALASGAVPAAKPAAAKASAKKVQKAQKIITKTTNDAVNALPSGVNEPSHINFVCQVTTSNMLINQVENIDAYDGDKLILVSQYANDIYNYLFTLEDEQPVRPNHLFEQNEVTPRMRGVLIDWINEVHSQYHLAPETFQIAVGIIDRYLQATLDTERSQLQLVGVTALFIAAKYEELFPPAIHDFVYITDDTYTPIEILRMEMKVFKMLDCNLSRPVPIHFLRRFSKAANAEDCHHNMAKYFIELVSVEYEFASYKPSEVAAASMFLALNLFAPGAKTATDFDDALWTPTLKFYSRYDVDHLRPISRRIAIIAFNAPNAKLKAIYTKYQASKFHKISLRPELYDKLMSSIVQNKD